MWVLFLLPDYAAPGVDLEVALNADYASEIYAQYKAHILKEGK